MSEKEKLQKIYSLVTKALIIANSLDNSEEMFVDGEPNRLEEVRDLLDNLDSILDFLINDDYQF